MKFFIDRFHTDYRLSKLAISFFDQKKNKMADSIPVKKKGSAKGPPSFVTPEYIEKQRQKKLEKMAKKAARKPIAPPSNAPPEFNTDFIKREMLSIPNYAPFETEKSALDITIMTYNVLAQTNIRRSMFPHSGEALKWKNRSRMLANELTYYSPTLGCMQEVDAEFVPNFYKKLLGGLGYELHFIKGEGKTHGIMIFWKSSLFKKVQDLTIYYDDHDELPGRMNTKNIGCCVRLERVDDPSRGLFLATTHLFWHPYGSYERLRQGAILVKEVNKMAQSHPSWPVFIAGDFNTEPFDTNFPALTTRPLSICQRATDIIERSMNYVFGESELEEKNASTKTENDSNEDDKEECQSSSTSSVPESTASTPKKRILHVQNDYVPHYRSFYQQHEQNPVLFSLYSVGYKLVHPENAKNTFDHPAFTNWAHAYQGHLDYIFVMNRDTSLQTPENQVVEGVKLKALLRVPLPSEMKEAEPLEGRYPSDHVALMANVQIV